MSEETKSRSLQEIQQEYSQVCTKAGHIQYQIDALKSDLSLINKTLRDLNFEGATAQAKSAAEAPKPAAESAAEEKSA